MWSNPQNQPPIEKIRKAQWSEENTQQTQLVVDRLGHLHDSLSVLGLTDAVNPIRLAMVRFQKLDPKVRLPW